MLLLLSVRPGAAQTNAKGWVDVNLGVAIASDGEFSSTRLATIAEETASATATYNLPRGASFDVGGGYMFSNLIGVGVSLSGTAHEDPAGLSVNVPHPLYFNAFGSDTATTDAALRRTEGAFHIQAMLVALDTGRARVRFFGGPSYFTVEQDTITNIRYQQTFQILNRGNSVSITEYDTQRSEGTGWGVHAGADASFFFNRIVGLGMLVRYSRATVSIDDYGGPQDVRAGGVQVGGGLRLRF
ncbi:MAG: outer membrane beta-barrel protein [Vicinamibacterales bacterium]